MLISRGRAILRHVSALTKQNRLPMQISVRNGGHEVFYRFVPRSPRYERIISEFMAGFMWWWIFWHLWHDWGHIVGEFDLPDPSSWTDEELGIPPDDAD
ncbi:NADH dehydrogenase [ubiquinone] 1 beta subcomplex subunit 2, mitochondrial-like [Chelonus insularis]|uniref:NADH dehydrogenase [ubiquinone] 1 beta subcomplex subunit 2, mitochondrial-like n=1 Tax=Chelonus insularis TaxID=460826 RepID=UPI00158B2BFD|nr:NADH dehydrogenase [ubiquinone] 1 beta subcomplex subunit 2, mitochondrial-like [Chelonus insularis]